METPRAGCSRRRFRHGVARLQSFVGLSFFHRGQIFIPDLDARDASSAMHATLRRRPGRREDGAHAARTAFCCLRRCLEYAPKMEKIISVTDLVRNATRIAEELEAKSTVYRITRGGRGSMVLVSEEYFQGWMAALDEMRRPNWREELEQSRRDAAAGIGPTLDEMVKELGLEDPIQPARRRATARASSARGTTRRKRPARARSRTA